VTGPQRRGAILDALRRGTVPRDGLATFAVGMERFEAAVDGDLATVASGRGGFKAVRGEYGSGKTFFGRWLQESSRAAGFATSEVQISATETPLHRWERVYRRLVERLATTDTPEGALRPTVYTWFYTLEEDVIAEGRIDPADSEALAGATETLMERRLVEVARTAPAFSAVFASLSPGPPRRRRCARGGIDRLARRSGQCRGIGETRCSREGRARPVRGDALFGGAADSSARLGSPRHGARARLSRDSAAYARRHPRERSQCAAPADRRN
jgi:hypothetical protein